MTDSDEERTEADRKTTNERWAALAERGFQIEVKGGQTALIDSDWVLKEPPVIRREFPDGYGPLPLHELRKRTVRRTRLWKDEEGYHQQDFVTEIYGLKPEVLQ